jgi:hypothetical protein
MFKTKTSSNPLKQITNQKQRQRRRPIRAILLFISGAAATIAGMAAKRAKTNYQQDPASFFDSLEQTQSRAFKALPPSIRNQEPVAKLQSKLNQAISEARQEAYAEQTRDGSSRSTASPTASVRTS